MTAACVHRHRSKFGAPQTVKSVLAGGARALFTNIEEEVNSQLTADMDVCDGIDGVDVTSLCSVIFRMWCLETGQLVDRCDTPLSSLSQCLRWPCPCRILSLFAADAVMMTVTAAVLSDVPHLLRAQPVDRHHANGSG